MSAIKNCPRSLIILAIWNNRTRGRRVLEAFLLTMELGFNLPGTCTQQSCLAQRDASDVAAPTLFSTHFPTLQYYANRPRQAPRLDVCRS